MQQFDSNIWSAQIERLNGAYAPATIKSYYTDMRALVDWCVRRGLNWSALSPEDVCNFLEHEARRGLCHGTLLRRVYSARRVFTLAGILDPTDDPEVGLCLRRIARARPTRPKQARGLSLAALNKFLDVQPDTPWGLRNRALLSLGYDLLARRSEITGLRGEDVTWRRDGTLEVILRRSKADQFGRGRIAFTSSRSAELLSDWLEWRGGDIAPLFCSIYRGVAINRPLSGSTVKNIIKSSARAAGYDPWVVSDFSAHSLRVGAAQELLRRGHDSVAIMRAGGWRTPTILARYLEKAEHNVWESA
jgi:site-specific recombinase XerD